MLKKLVLSMVALAFMAIVPASPVLVVKPQSASAVVLAGFGRAVIDGAMSPGEWDRAGCVGFVVNLPGGSTTPALAYVMNDVRNLYIAVVLERDVLDAGSVIVEFDNDHDMGPIREEGDDIIQINSSPLAPDPISFEDQFRTYKPPCCANCLCGFKDVDHGGTADGAGRVANDQTVSVYELRHPLLSGDLDHDFCLVPGDVVGFTLQVRIIWDGVIADTFFPVLPGQNSLFGDILVLRPGIQDIEDLIAGLSDEAFVNNPAQRKNALGEKLKVVRGLIDVHNYASAIDKLENDLRSKADGCFGGNPNNDWIVDCGAQEALLSMLDAVIDYLASLL